MEMNPAGIWNRQGLREMENREGQNVSNHLQGSGHGAAETDKKTGADSEPQPIVGRVIKKDEMAGVRRLSRIVGVIIFIGSFGAFPIGTLVGFLIMIGLFIAGRQVTTKYYCSSCGNPIDTSKVRICPSCKTSLR